MFTDLSDSVTSSPKVGQNGLSGPSHGMSGLSSIDSRVITLAVMFDV